MRQAQRRRSRGGQFGDAFGRTDHPGLRPPLCEEGECTHHPTSKICRSIRFVCVGPVMMRSPVAFRKLKESLERRKFWGINPSSIAREHVNGSTSPPAALVGPSLPSVATLAKQACDENGRDATEIAHASAIS